MKSNFQTAEIWKPIPSLEGLYEVSSAGRVRSVDREVDGFSFNGGRAIKIRRKSHLLTQGTRGRGYRYVCLSANGKSWKESIQKLVLTAFVGPRPDGMHACHNNGNPADNRIENLRWDTPTANQYDRVAHGTDLRGESVTTAKLTEWQARMIREGMRFQLAAKEFGVSKSQFYRIRRGEAWAHVKC